MPNPPVRLKVLLREKHWQTHQTFCREYDKAAKSIDSDLIGSWPSRAQFHRWLSGELKGLPYPHHCRVLESMLPGWTVDQLFEHCPPEDVGQPASKPEGAMGADVADVLAAIEDRGEAMPAGAIGWGTATGTVPAAKARLQTLPGTTRSGQVHDVGRSLRELQSSRQLSDAELTTIASLAGNVIELSKTVDLHIDAEGAATIAYRFDMLNLSDTPQAGMSREVWFEHTTGPLVIKPTPDIDRRVGINRLHDTANLAKFAFQISPPLRPGEAARIGYICEGGKFDLNHYWREAMPRHCRRYSIRVRQVGIDLTACTATEEHPDGSENSATDSLTWDYEGEDAVMSLTRDYLSPNEAVTLRWEVARGSA